AALDPAAPGAAASAAVRLLSDAGGRDVARVRDLVGLCSKQMDEQAPLLEAAIAAGDAGEVRRIAHRCAGSVASCGMVGVVPPLRDLERMGKERRLADAPRAFAELERRSRMVRDRPREHRAAPPAMPAAR